MRVYYNDQTDEILSLEGFRKGADGNDEPSPGTYLEAPDVDFEQYNPADYLIVDGVFTKKDQAIIDQRIIDEQTEVERLQAINDAQDKVINRMAEAIDGVYKVMLREGVTLNLSAKEITFGNEVRDDYDAFVALRDA